MSTQQLNLAQTEMGEIVTISGLLSDGPMRRRLQDIGFTAGTSVQRLQSGPSGDPTAFYVKGTVIALRKEDSARILVEKN